LTTTIGAGGEVNGDMAERDEPTGALVRPYAVTRGRTRPRVDIAIEALIETTVRGRTASSRPGGNNQGSEQQYIATMCDNRVQSLAEISARLHLPLGVARVLVADMAAEGLVSVHEPTSLDDNEAVGTELLERVLSGLRRL
jgi:Protein of unknown function (DUF742)